MITIENKHLRVKIKRVGAELCSIVGKADSREYLWQGDPQYWHGQAPLLFPTIGGLNNGQLRIDDKVFKMAKHGFVRNYEFAVEQQTDDAVTMTLCDNEETRMVYPRAFSLAVTYKLVDATLSVEWQVRNTGRRAMPFQIGAHPAFNLSEWNADDAVHGYLSFNVTDRLVSDYLTRNGLRARGVDAAISLTPMHEEATAVGEKVATFDVALDDDGRLPLTNTTFECDTIIDARRLLNSATLHDKKGERIVTVRFNMPYLAIWAPKNGCAPFVCIEPWCGCCDIQDYDGLFADRDIINSLLPGETFTNEYSMEF